MVKSLLECQKSSSFFPSFFRRLRRNDEGRVLEGEDEVLEVVAKYWEEFGRKRDDTEAEMGDEGGNELVMCEEVSWEELVEVMKCLKR